ncbi:MAG: PepSY-like domain-containing protein [Chitinophagaceae bacterium]
MKKTIVALVLLGSIPAMAQKVPSSKVPEAARVSFTKNFPKAENAKWEKEKAGYEVNFREGKQVMSAVIMVDGTLKETEKSIPISSLPAKVKVYLAAHFKAEKIKEAAELKMADGSINYEAEVKGIDQIFDHEGNYLRSQKD